MTLVGQERLRPIKGIWLARAPSVMRFAELLSSVVCRYALLMPSDHRPTTPPTYYP